MIEELKSEKDKDKEEGKEKEKASYIMDTKDYKNKKWNESMNEWCIVIQLNTEQDLRRSLIFI